MESIQEQEAAEQNGKRNPEMDVGRDRTKQFAPVSSIWHRSSTASNGFAISQIGQLILWAEAVSVNVGHEQSMQNFRDRNPAIDRQSGSTGFFWGSLQHFPDW